jgi:hypothetical protein
MIADVNLKIWGLLSVALTCCHDPHQRVSGSFNDKKDPIIASDTSDADKVKVNTSNNYINTTRDLNCDDLLVLLIKGSSIDPEVKKMKFSARVDEINDLFLRIELTIKNNEREEDVPLSWVEIDKNKRELKDVTVDPGKPILLKYDSAVFNEVLKGCKLAE